MTNELGLELQQPTKEKTITRQELQSAYDVLILPIVAQCAGGVNVTSPNKLHKKAFGRWPKQSMIQFCENYLNASKCHD